MNLAQYFLTYAGAAFYPACKTRILEPTEPVTRKGSMTSQIEAEIPRRTILVVDDEPSILKCIQRVLEQANYDVIISPSGNQAWELIEQGRPKIDMVLTDIVMPGSIDGFTLDARIRRREPSLPVLFITGAQLEDDDSAAQLAIKKRSLRKPFLAKELVEFVDSHFPSRIL
jgi:CheY-like chemotaxis protein